MTTLSKTGGATIVVSSQTVQYAGNDVNNFFGGSGDRVAMLAFGAPSALGTDEQVSTAVLKCWLKADTTPDSDNITIGLIDSSWGGGNSGFPGMYAALTINTSTVFVGTGLEASEVSLPVAGLIQMWAANPGSFSGLYLRCPTLSLARVGATGCSIEYETVTRSAAVAPTSLELTGAVVEYPPMLRWSGAKGGTNNDLIGYEIQVSDSYDGNAFGPWQALTIINTTETSGSQQIPLPAIRGMYRWVRIRTRGAAGYHSAWVDTIPFKRNSLPNVPIFSYPQHNMYSFNPNPRLLITMGNEPDDQLMTLEQITNFPPFKISSPGPYQSGRRIMIQRDDAGQYSSEGEVIIAVAALDEMGLSSGMTTRKLSVIRLMQMIGIDKFESGKTRVAALHITRIRDAIQALRSSYGIETTSWESGDVVAGTTPLSKWRDHILEIRTVIDLIIQRINTWDETAVDCLVEQPEWIPITGTQPRADVMQQICDVIMSL